MLVVEVDGKKVGTRVGYRVEKASATAARRPCESATPSGPVRTSDEHHDDRTETRPRCRASRRATARRSSPQLREEFGYANVMQVPGLAKIVVNMGVGDAAKDSKLIDGADPRPGHRSPARSRRSPRPASRSRSSSCARACRSARTSRCAATGCGSSSTGCCRSRCRASATSAACRRGSSTASGNYTFGLNEQSMFHEIDQDRIDRVRGMDITVVTTAKTDDEGRALLRAPRLPVQGGLTVAKTALVNKADAQAEVQGARLHPLPALRPAALGLPQVRPVPHLLPRDGAPRRAARHHQEQLVTHHLPSRPPRTP